MRMKFSRHLTNQLKQIVKDLDFQFLLFLMMTLLMMIKRVEIFLNLKNFVALLIIFYEKKEMSLLTFS